MPPPRARLMLALLALGGFFVIVLAWPRSAAAGGARAGWRWPVRGAVVGAFRYSPRAPFAAGRRRGIDIAAARGVAVRSACSGRVTFAGPAPGGRGRGV